MNSLQTTCCEVVHIVAHLHKFDLNEVTKSLQGWCLQCCDVTGMCLGGEGDTGPTTNTRMFPFSFKAGDLARFTGKQDFRLLVGSCFTGRAGLQRLVTPTLSQSRSAPHHPQYYKNKLEVPEWAPHNKNTAITTVVTSAGPAACVGTIWSVCKVLFSHILVCVYMILFHWHQATDHNSFILMKKKTQKTDSSAFSLSPLLCNTLALFFPSNSSSTVAIDANAGHLQHKWEGKQFLRKPKTSL